MAVFLAFVFFSLALSFECSDEEEPAAVSHLQVDLRTDSCQASFTEEDLDRPIVQVLADHPGQDGWCFFGLEMGESCHRARASRDLSFYHQLLGSPGPLDCPTMRLPKTIVLPGIEVAPGMNNVTLADSNALGALDCFANGFWKSSAQQMIHDFDAVELFSTFYCQFMPSLVPDFNKITMRDFLNEQAADQRKLCELLSSDSDAVHAPTSLKKGMELRGAVRCLLDHSEGAVCDMAGCASNFCMTEEGMYRAKTETTSCGPEPPAITLNLDWWKEHMEDVLR
mmetsp:Transcript_70926/g.166432  ORF Transcript_70926/g.166432 Transcript_70926/m.166432 type:complete len:282 (+) Transcript_70926:66-911(+)